MRRGSLRPAAARISSGQLVIGPAARDSGRSRLLADDHGGSWRSTSADRSSGLAGCRVGEYRVGYVDTPEGNAALREAHALARRTGAVLRVVHVMRVTPGMHLEVETYVAGQIGKGLETVEGEHKLRIERELQVKVAALGDDVRSTTMSSWTRR